MVQRRQAQKGLLGSLEWDSWEQPPNCGSWKLRRVNALKSLGWEKWVFLSCPWGHHDPGNLLPYRKAQCFASNANLATLVLPCTCPEHQQIEGVVESGPRQGERRSEVSGEYPQAMCQELATIMRQELRALARLHC